jgi:four helix bundle protein
MNTAAAKPDEDKFDLAERTARFGESILRFAKSVKRTEETRPLIRQVVRSGTSIGANYLEADEAGTKSEFRYRISICKREIKETRYWLRMIVCACPSVRDSAAELWKEASELNLIFAAIYRSSAEKKQN